MDYTMSIKNQLPGLIHILDDNAIQKSLIARILATERIETAGHDCWEDFCFAYCANRSFCLIVNHDLFHPSMFKQVTIRSLDKSKPLRAFSSNRSVDIVIDVPIILYAD